VRTLKTNYEFKEIETFFPATYRSASKLSGGSQNNYLRIVKADLVVLVLSAALSLIPRDNASLESVLRISAFLLILSGTFLFGFLIFLNLDKDWYGARAIAETIKSVTWQFLLDAGPFARLKNVSQKELWLLKDIQDTRERELGLSSKISVHLEPDNLEISEPIQAFKKLKFSTRKDLYVEIRVRGQKGWYLSKSKFNKNRKWIWYLLIFFIHLLALLSAYEGWIDLTALLVAVAGASFSWLQLKRHQELEESYSVAAGDLGIIESKFKRAKSKMEISALVMECEKAISREHNIWVFRGGIIPKKKR
jgi:SMODS and SLOG-associating 2TM effector domain 1/SMODS and SLOG-associating 2TM effector domain 3